MSTIRTNKINLVPGTGQTALTLPNYTQVEQLYSMSGTIRFDTAVNNGQYQPTDYNSFIKRYGNIGSPPGFGPNGAVPVFHGQHTGTVNESTWCSDKELFNVIAGCQLWRVPITATYTLTARGAGRNSSYAGYGISLTCDFKLYAGEWLRIICGAQGRTDNSTYGGGNGASCISVFRQGMHMPVLIAGGGAGTSNNSPQSNNTNRNATAPNQNTFTPNGETHYTARDGIGGAGSWYSNNYDSPLTHWGGGGGGGWGSPGGGGSIGQASPGEDMSGGRALSSQCPHGGYYTNAGTNYWGGFGGGGGTGVDGGAAGGGGGWYGGNATYVKSTNSDDTSGLGGGSFCAADTFTNNGTHGNYGQVDVSL
jgi:hypothetical protein